MDSLTHTIIAVGSLAISFYLGSYLKTRSVFDLIAHRMLDKLEQDGFIEGNLFSYQTKSLVKQSIFEYPPMSRKEKILEWHSLSGCNLLFQNKGKLSKRLYHETNILKTI